MKDIRTFDEASAISALPNRSPDGNKGSFGKLLMICGSRKFPGAALLSLEAALRGGCGYTALASFPEVVSHALLKFPETLLFEIGSYSGDDFDRILKLDGEYSVTLIGPGSERCPELARLTSELMMRSSSPLIIDADAINSISELGIRQEEIRTAKRPIIFTPHPMEFSRLTGYALCDILSHRKELAARFARESGAVVLLKGKGTVITDGNTTLVNASGSAALAKAGSGDTLAGLLGALLAQGLPTLDAAALAAYVHGAAGDALEKRLSPVGVTPSDLPTEMAKILATLYRKNANS